MEIVRLPSRASLANKSILINDMPLNVFIKKIRLECGLSQTELSHILGHHDAVVVCNWETGRRIIKAETFFKILSACSFKMEIKENIN